MYKGHYGTALSAYKKMIGIIERLREPGHLDFAICVTHEGDLHFLYGKYKEVRKIS